MNRQFAAQECIGKIYALLRTPRPEPGQYVWKKASTESRRDWLAFAGLDLDLSRFDWQKLSERERAQLGRVLAAMSDFFSDVGLAARKVPQ